jgi:hypothetical protein
MNQSVKYRKNAAECHEAVQILTDSRKKANLLAMAHSWISLADYSELDSHFEAATTRFKNQGNGPGVIPYLRHG